MTENTYGIPALLSFLCPGMGQLVKKHIYKAISAWLIVLVLIYFAVIPQTFGVVYYLSAFLFWNLNVYDAYNSDSDFMSR